MAYEDLFEKVAVLKSDDEVGWELPLIELQSKKHHLTDERVVELKKALNDLKGTLNDYEIGDWHKHTTYCNPSGLVNREIRYQFHPELCTQAWCKFHEILCFDQVIPESSLCSHSVAAVHICEAPGAFICSLNHYLKSHYKHVRYKWVACTLNPYYEGNDADSCVADDRLIFRTPNRWCFGPDNTGNIFSRSLLEDVCKKAADLGPVCLVTADGSFNCQKNPAEQELDTSCLKFTEMLYGLSILGLGGTFVLKIFTPLEYTSVQLLYILCCTFTTVKIRKPATSKPGNSELYVVAKGYKKLSGDHPLIKALTLLCTESEPAPLDLFCTHSLPSDFLTRYKNCVETFVHYQMEAIQRNIQSYEKKATLDLDEVHQIVAAIAIEKMRLMNIPRNQCIIKSGVLKKPLNSNIDLRPKMSGTFADRKLFQPLVHTRSAFEVEKRTDLTWISCSCTLATSNTELTFGKTLHSIKTSLFCDTGTLMALYDCRQYMQPQDERYNETALLVVHACLREMVSSGNGKVYEADVWVGGNTCADVLGIEPFSCKSLKLSSPIELAAGSVLLASLIKREYEANSVREVSSLHQLLKLVLYVLQNNRSGANLIVVLPSALTRLTAGLLHILFHTYGSYAITCVNHTTPALLVFCKAFQESGRFTALLESALQCVSELPVERSLLGILPIAEILKDETFVKTLKRCNHVIVNALKGRHDDFVL